MFIVISHTNPDPMYKQVEDQIKNAIIALPSISGSGTGVSSAMVLIRDQLFQSCPLRTGSQCVALILYDDGADNTTAVDIVAQVSRCFSWLADAGSLD